MKQRPMTRTKPLAVGADQEAHTARAARARGPEPLGRERGRSRRRCRRAACARRRAWVGALLHQLASRGRSRACGPWSTCGSRRGRRRWRSACCRRRARSPTPRINVTTRDLTDLAREDLDAGTARIHARAAERSLGEGLSLGRW